MLVHATQITDFSMQDLIAFADTARERPSATGKRGVSGNLLSMKLSELVQEAVCRKSYQCHLALLEVYGPFPKRSRYNPCQRAPKGMVRTRPNSNHLIRADSQSASSQSDCAPTERGSGWPPGSASIVSS